MHWNCLFGCPIFRRFCEGWVFAFVSRCHPEPSARSLRDGGEGPASAFHWQGFGLRPSVAQASACGFSIRTYDAPAVSAAVGSASYAREICCCSRFRCHPEERISRRRISPRRICFCWGLYATSVLRHRICIGVLAVGPGHIWNALGHDVPLRDCRGGSPPAFAVSPLCEVARPLVP